jgi:hypothetical protein
LVFKGGNYLSRKRGEKECVNECKDGEWYEVRRINYDRIKYRIRVIGEGRKRKRKIKIYEIGIRLKRK